VNLRGFDSSGRVMDPAEAVRGFLDALGVPPDEIPPSQAAQEARYRSLLAGRRILVVLDNARDAEQVRPLLPGTPTAVVVVTSRNQLTGLLATDGAHPLTLDVMSPDESRDMLVQRLGNDQVAAEPGAVRDIIAACARLALALGIAAARAQQSGFPLAALAAELGEAGHRLSVLDAGDPASDVRAVFSWSYTTLDPAAARLFRLLGVHPGPDLSTAAAAALAGIPLPAVRRLLTGLVRANLLVEHAPGRYTQHDLLRAYATDLTRTHDPAGARDGALTRLLDHYTHTACAANRLLYPTLHPIALPLADPVAGAGPEHLADARSATEWLSAEHANLLAALGRAGDRGMDEYAWQLAWGLDTFHYRQQHWRDHASAWQTALAAADRLGSLTAKAYAHRRLGVAYRRVDRPADAYAEFQTALNLSVDAGDGDGQAAVLLDLTILADSQGDLRQALDHAEQGLALARAGGHERQLANALNSVGWMYATLNDYGAALTALREGLALSLRLGDSENTAFTLDSLGYTLRHLGDYVEAIECYERSTAIFGELGLLEGVAQAQDGLGDTYQAAGDTEAALAAWRRALPVFIEIKHSTTQTIRDKIRTHTT
jgi:tetratricopeptide (TPR) repeat protein/CheY-like chemotaxis protein